MIAYCFICLGKNKLKIKEGLCFAGVLLLAACCGGGGGSTDTPPNQPDGAPQNIAPSPPPVQEEAPHSLHLPELPTGWQTDRQAWAEHDEFQAQAGLATVKADAAYAKGLTGKGVTLGFIDTGFEALHEEFAGKRIALNDRSGLARAGNRQLRHGTGVASIALGARGHGQGLHGVAFDADPAMWSLNLDSDGFLDVNGDILARATRALQNSGARVINQSWGHATLLDPGLSDAQRQFLRGSYGAFLSEIRKGKAIHVWAAGNEGGDEISVSTAWPILFPELAGLSIAVAALGEDGIIGRNSNRCGVAKHHCLVAPGGAAIGGSAFTKMARAGGGYRTASGTSYAAPYVAGVLALMQQAFGDQLSLPEYSARLLATANKQGVYADEAVYGQGLVDAEAALTPQGDVHIPLPAGGLIAPRDSAIEGGLLPEEMLERLRRERIIVLDELNAPFIAQIAVKPDPYQSFELTRWMTHGDNKTAPYSHPVLAGFAELFDGPALGDYWQLVPLALRDNSLNGDPLPKTGFGFAARRTRRRTRLEMGMVAEKDSLMGTSGTGALKLGNAHTALVGFAQDFDIGETLMRIDAQLSFSHAEGDVAALVHGTKGALASSFGLHLQQGDVALSLKQPTFFEHGTLRLNVPVRRIAGGGMIFEKRDFSMRGAQRPFELKLTKGDALARIGLKLDVSDARRVKLGLGYFRRF